ncbi:hypothetical protein bcgnr5372_41110 [Bacillus luti]|nr:hypothetical protein [Bacillus cereus]HDR8327644.1 hypothetical protein [Bacillus cereus]HDR8334353.1 hypothetical protein [Bacillus cereus]
MELGNWAFGNSRGSFPVNRDWQNMFCEHLYDMGFDSYGVIDSKHEHLEKYVVKIEGTINEPTAKFENNTFVIMPYYWGDDDEICMLPNFIYKPTGFELSWYKYALRDSYMNHNISYQELDGLLKLCKQSLEKK